MDWAPITALKEFRKIVDIMDKGSQYILTERKRTFSLLEESSEQGRDIMSIMCKPLVSSWLLKSKSYTHAWVCSTSQLFIVGVR